MKSRVHNTCASLTKKQIKIFLNPGCTSCSYLSDLHNKRSCKHDLTTSYLKLFLGAHAITKYSTDSLKRIEGKHQDFKHKK